MSSTGPKLLAIDEDRAAQAQVAAAFNDAGVFYRFISARAKVLGALKQIKPDALLVFAEIQSPLCEEILTSISTDVAHARLPVIVVCRDLGDSPFVAGLRTGVIGLIQAPFDAKQHLPEVRELLQELPTRRGVVSGFGGSTDLARLVEHLRRTRRSGQLTFDPRTPQEGRATFVTGKVESATYGTLDGIEALVAMVTRPQGQWHFAEVGGEIGEGNGVVIEVLQGTPDEEEVAVVLGVAEDEAPTLEFEVPHTSPPPSVPPPPPVERPRLLLVDDDEALCRMFSTLFTKHGFHIATAADGIDGYAAAQGGSYDAVIADLNMPRMDGWGMLRQLRDDYRTRELPLAFLSCHDDYRESLRAHDAGAQAYFPKGGRLDGLVSQVRKLLAPRQALAQRIAQGGEDAEVPIGEVGPQWLVSTLAKSGFTGLVEAKDGWASYQLFFNQGAPRHASAQAGRHRAEGERAFNAFIASKGAVGKVCFGHFPSPQSLFHSAEQLVARACATLTENERRVRETLLVTAGNLDVDQALYAIYREVGPRQWLEAARLVCEENVPPRELIARLDASPLEVEDMLKDLLRRGVVTLQRSA